MGLLDEAIREHLELKRLHGADPSEVARQEHEALGPVRREADADSAESLDALEGAVDAAPVEAAAASAAPVFPEDDIEWVDEDEEDVDVAPAAAVDQPTEQFSLAELEAEEEEAAGSMASHDVEGDGATVAFDVEEPPASHPEPEVEEPAPAAHRPAEADPMTDEEPDVVPADEDGPAEDVLEETPEFLQETPEHDRLWFEQKPPRDFDF